MRDYKKIKAWQYADDLTVAIYRESKLFPREELYALTNQIRRAAYSVPSNIAEGAGRSSKKDYLHFLYIARASLNETQYFVHLASRLGYLKQEQAEALEKLLKGTFARLYGLIEAVKKEAGLFGRVTAFLTSTVMISMAGKFLHTI
ncbi:MAG: four helix bundle protein [Candidatus Pacebacteria bacterium]|nr:four helix bundle protein [Candidatus Paceibacterota bacterium]